MQYNHLLTATVASLVIASVSIGDTESSTKAMNQMRITHPSLTTMEQFGNTRKLYDKELATGNSPLASAEAFIDLWS